MSLSKDSGAYQQIAECTHHLQNGVVLCIDPSIGSSSSQPGYALYRKGELFESGILPIAPDGTVHARLQKLRSHMYNLISIWQPDVLVYEDIPSQRHGGGNANAHASLLKAVGVILSISGPEHYVGLLPISWKRMARPSYTKGDREDAVEVGYIAIAEAARIEEAEGKRYGKPSRSTGPARRKSEKKAV